MIVLLEDMKTKLTGISASIFLGDLPDSPDELIALFNSGGENELITFGGYKIHKPSFQVRVSSKTQATALTMIE